MRTNVSFVFLLTWVLAFDSSIANAALPRGISGDHAADRILGKPDFSEVNPYTTVAGKLWLPHGVVVDRSSPTRNRLYIYDGGNNRILGLDLNTCRSSSSGPLGCTATIVIGQHNMNTSACNGDSGFQNYPLLAPASASSLCGEQEAQLSISEGGSGASMALDSAGNLYVTDFWNHRVLKYNDPFGTDRLADDIWGQNDFRGNSCNKGMASPDATSLCFGWGESNNWTAGVDRDAGGNLWVVDSGNNRVLRFAPGSKTANLVLGQPDFTSRDSGTALNQLWDPSAVRVSPTTGWVYVSESRNDRVLVFKPPFAIGMAGSLFGSGFQGPQGVDFDPTEPGAVWIANRGHSTIELWSESTRAKIREVGWRDNGNVIGDGSGSVGIDSAGNLYVAIGTGDHDNDVLVFDKGAAPNLPTKRLFGTGGNLPTASSLGGSVEGVVVSDGQLIVADGNRLLFWNNPASLVSGQPADGYAAGASGFADLRYGCCGIMTADRNHRLWVTGYLNADTPVRVDVYQLPLIRGAGPVQSLRFPFNVLGGGQVNADDLYQPFTGIAVSSAGELWLSHSGTSRVFRLRNPLTSPQVDVVLGQISSTGTACNRGGSAVANSLCTPGHVSFDRFGNLFVSDHSLEIQGNMRLLEFSATLLPSGNATVLYAPAVTKVFPNVATWQPAFDSHNHMVVGYNPYWAADPQGGWFPGLYSDPLSASTTPDGFLLDYHSMAYSAAFDENDNLYVTDLDRSRVLYYAKPTASLTSLTSITVTPSSVCGGSSATGTATLDGAAPPGGATVALSTESDAGAVPQSVTIPAGAVSATFPVVSYPVMPCTMQDPCGTSGPTSLHEVTILGTYGGVTRSATLSVTPTWLAGLTVNPSTVSRGSSATGTVTLTIPAPGGMRGGGGRVVSLSSSNPTSASVPATVTVPPGATEAKFSITTFTGGTSSSVTITATVSNCVAAATLNLTP